jgi:hypothetical protein
MALRTKVTRALAFTFFAVPVCAHAQGSGGGCAALHSAAQQLLDNPQSDAAYGISLIRNNKGASNYLGDLDDPAQIRKVLAFIRAGEGLNQTALRQVQAGNVQQYGQRDSPSGMEPADSPLAMVQYYISVRHAWRDYYLCKLTSLEGVVDVRMESVTSSDTRALTDDEDRRLRASLKWSPQIAPLELGATASTTLTDSSDHILARIRITWNSVQQPKPSKTGTAGASVANFTVTLDNASTCVFKSSAQLKVPEDLGYVVNVTDWFGWVALQDPSPGKTSEVAASAIYGRSSKSLQLLPTDPTNGSILSQCRTAKTN